MSRWAPSRHHSTHFMKIYSIAATINLENKPRWLDDFRKKYDKPYDFHLTFQNSCTIESSKVTALKQNLKQFFLSHPLKEKPTLVFDRVYSDPEDPEGATIMLKPSKSPTKIMEFQKRLLSAMEKYQNYLEPQNKIYDQNFVPHMTIARDLSLEKYQVALAELPRKIQCTGNISSVTLYLVDTPNLTEVNNPNNQTTFYFTMLP